MDVFASNFVFFVFSFLHFISFKGSYALTHTHTSNYRLTSTLDPIGNGSAIANYDFENPIYQAEDEGKEDCEVPWELARLLQQEERVIQPHEEPLDTINLGTEKDKKEIKVPCPGRPPTAETDDCA